MLGLLCVGVMMYLLLLKAGHYYIEGVGYATVMDILHGTLRDPRFLMMLVALKLLATCLSLGSGPRWRVFACAVHGRCRRRRVRNAVPFAVPRPQ